MAVVPFTSTVKLINWEDLSARKTRIVARRSSKRSARKCVLMWSAKYPESPGRLTYSTKYFNKLHSLQRTVRLFCQTENSKAKVKFCLFPSNVLVIMSGPGAWSDSNGRLRVFPQLATCVFYLWYAFRSIPFAANLVNVQTTRSCSIPHTHFWKDFLCPKQNSLRLLTRKTSFALTSRFLFDDRN